MKKTSQKMAMATPCPYQNVKRPMSERRRHSRANRAPHLFLILLLITSLTAQHLNAQTAPPAPAQSQTTNYTLTGTVTDSQHNPLPGATLTEAITRAASQTDSKGNFSLSTSTQTGKLTVSYLGYQSKTISYSTGSPLTIQLSEDPSALRPVEVNAGYYSVAQRQLTGAITTISAKDIEKQPVTNPLQALQGRVSGAYISQSTGTPGANMNIIIRGQNGIETSTNPLYIVDGVPYNSTSLFNNLSATVGIFSAQGSSPLNAIPPEEISSIEILKDADATAIYGSRGANGVVLITTKKAKSGRTTVELSTSSGISEASQRIAMLGTQDYLALRRMAIELDGGSIKPADYDLNGTWDQSKQTNWQNELFGRTARFSTVRAAISGGTAQHSFLISGTYQSQGTVYQGGQRYNRASVHLSSSHSSADNTLSASFSVLYSSDRTNWLNGDYITRGLSLSPNSPELRNPDGSLNWASSSWVNPLRSEENKYLAANSGLTANASLSYSPIKDLQLRASLGWQQQSLQDRSYIPVSYYNPAEGRTSATSVSDFNSSALFGWTIEPQGSYKLDTKIGRFNVLVGLSLQDQQRDQQIQRGSGFASDALIENIAAATTIQIRSNSQNQYRYSGAYARFNYILKDRYILNLTGRKDASSRFGTGRRSAAFGALAVAYLFSEEKSVKQILPFLSYGKLRASYGTSGNDQIGDYEYLDTYGSLPGYNGQPGLSPLRLFNADFGWEENKKLEIGLDLGFFSDRLSATIAHFRNRSSSQLIDYPLAYSTGFSSIRANLAATIENTGWEIELSSRNIQGTAFSWTSSFNLTLPNNRLVAFPNLEASSYSSSYVIGEPLNISKLLELKGVNPATGIYEFTDFNGDKAINTADRLLVRKRGQSAYGGLENTFRYKKLELGFLFQFVAQRATTLRSQHSIMPGRLGNQPQAYQGNYWLKPGDIASLQRPSAGGIAAANTALSNYLISDAVNSDASFIKLKNLQLAYRTDKVIRGLPIRISLQGQNLWTISRYFGLDPENTTLLLPPLRTITLGLNVSL